MVGNNLSTRVEGQSHFTSHVCFRLPDVLGSEEELPVQVGHVDGVQIDNLQSSEENKKAADARITPSSTERKRLLAKQACTDLNVLKTAEHEVLHQLATDSASTDNKHARTADLSQRIGSLQAENETTMP